MSDGLIEYGGRKIARRPTSYSEEVASAVFDFIKQELADAMGYHVEQIERDRSSFIQAALLKSQDGYQMTRYLDDYCGWPCDRNVVEILDDAPWSNVHREFVMQWRSYWKLEPLFKVGDKVKYSWNGEQFSSAIVDVTQIGWTPASYTMAPQPEESGRHIVYWENCQAIDEPEARP